MKKNIKRILAILAILLLLALYVTTLVAALIGSDAAINLFRSCVYGTISIPILLWIFISIFKRLSPENTEDNQISTDSIEKKN